MNEISPEMLGKAPKIVRHVGQLNSVMSDGREFKRQELIYIPNMGVIKTTPYDNHFVFRDDRRKGWTLFCTCGYAAVVVGYEAYKKDASDQGAMMVCLMHAQTGKHADGSS